MVVTFVLMAPLLMLAASWVVMLDGVVPGISSTGIDASKTCWLNFWNICRLTYIESSSLEWQVSSFKTLDLVKF